MTECPSRLHSYNFKSLAMGCRHSSTGAGGAMEPPDCNIYFRQVLQAKEHAVLAKVMVTNMIKVREVVSEVVNELVLSE